MVKTNGQATHGAPPLPQIWNENPDPQQKLCVVFVQVSSKTQIFLGQKIPTQNIRGQKKFRPNCFGSKKIPTQVCWVKKYFWPKIFGFQKFLIKIFGAKKISDQNFVCPKKFRPTFFWVKKQILTHIFLGKKIFRPKYFWLKIRVRPKFEPNFFLTLGRGILIHRFPSPSPYHPPKNEYKYKCVQNINQSKNDQNALKNGKKNNKILHQLCTASPPSGHTLKSIMVTEGLLGLIYWWSFKHFDYSKSHLHHN